MSTVEPMGPVAVGTRGAAGVRVGLPLEPPRQKRWSVLIRALLALPLRLALVGIGLAMQLMVVGAWFASMITGRVPDELQPVLTNWLRAYVNVSAYSALLTSAWPDLPFSPTDSAQATIEIDHVGLRRSAVFFRFVLSVPALLLLEVVAIGLVPFQLVMWVVGVVRGRTPRALHQATAAVVRFEVRTLAYVDLVTPTQPFRGFLGDGTDPTAGNEVLVAPTFDVGAGLVATSVAGEDAARLSPGISWPASAFEPALPPASPPVWAEAPSGPPAGGMELPTHWSLTKGARAVVVSTILIGVAAVVAYSVLSVVVAGRVSATSSDKTALEASYARTGQVWRVYASTAPNCTGLACASSTARTAGDQLDQDLTTFVNSYRPIRASTPQYDAYVKSLIAVTNIFASIGSNPYELGTNGDLVRQISTTMQQYNANAQALDKALSG